MTGQWIDDKTYWEDPKDKPAFALGDQVEKVGGRYGGPGRIVSVSEDMGDGYRLFGVAMKVEGGYGEFVHVFPAAALKKIEQMTEKGEVFVGGLPDAQPRGRVNNAGQYGVGAITRLVRRPYRGATRKMESGAGAADFRSYWAAGPFSPFASGILRGEVEVIFWKELARSARVELVKAGVEEELVRRQDRRGDFETAQRAGAQITLYVSNMNVALLFVFAVIGIEVYGVIFGGWAANSKYAVLGSLRTCAQMISYEIPMGFAVIGVVMLAQSMSLLDIVRAQADVWNIVYQPVGFFVFFVAGLAEAQRIPFDLAEAEGDLGAGFHTEYSGIRFAFFMVSEYAIMLLVSVLAVILFFGGWNGVLIPLPPLVWFALKVAFFVYLFMWFRFTFPRYRYDQLMAIGWKVLLPLSLANIIITGVAFL